MGQYHRAVCIEAEEGLNPYTLGTGAKEGEQGFSRPAAPNAIVALVCARGGNQPADCSQSPVIGRWAGKRVLVQGDYAEDGDIPGWQGPPLSLLYHSMDSQEERDDLTEHRQKLIAEGMKGIKAPDWSFPIYADISREARDFLEGVCNVRYFEQVSECKDMVPGSQAYGQIIDRWSSTHWVNVRPLAREFGDSGVAEYVIDPGYSAKDLEYLKRCGLNPQDVMRPPRSGDWHGFVDGQITQGQTRVIVNLDTLEYINPVRFGQPPTLAGMVRQAPKNRRLPILKKAAKDNDYLVDVAGGLFAMLCHRERRGGGDLPANAEELSVAYGGNPRDPRAKYARLYAGCEDVKGRWRGGHILGTRQFEAAADWSWPSTEEVIEKGTDISDRVIKYLVAVSHY